MKSYRVTAEGKAIETYYLNAGRPPTIGEARAWITVDNPLPSVSEVVDIEVVSVEEVAGS